MYIKKIVFDKRADSGVTFYLHDQKTAMEHIEERPYVLVLPGGGAIVFVVRERLNQSLYHL